MAVKIIYNDLAPYASENANFVSNGIQDFCDISLLALDFPDIFLATLEKNQFGLTGNFSLLSNQEIAYISSELSDEEGSFITNPLITTTFTTGKYSSSGITITFDLLENDFASELILTWYNEEQQISQKTFYPNMSSYFCENRVETYDKVTVEIVKTSKPLRYAKLSHIYFGAVRPFELDELKSVKITKDLSPISSEVPVNTLQWELISLSNIDYIFQGRQKIQVFNNDNLLGTFYVEKGVRSSIRDYSITCVDALGILEDDTFKGDIYSNEMLLNVLTDIIPDFETNIEEGLLTKTITGYIPPGSKKDALQQVLFAIGAVVDTNNTEEINIHTLQSTNPLIVPNDRIYQGGSVEILPIVTSVSIVAHTYVEDTGQGEAGDDIITVNDVKYIHTTNTTTKTNPNVNSSDKTNEILIDKATLINTANETETLNRIFNYYMRQRTQNVKFVVDEEEIGDLITSETTFNTDLTGNLISANLTLSGKIALEGRVLAI